MKQMTRTQSGFTLVEIAIVLVIIGLLLGGVLKGQEMIENSRIKSVVNDMNGISAAYNSYYDRYRAIPGDETAATMTARGWTGTLGGDGDGALEITVAQTFTNGGEQGGFWRALRASGMTSGDPTAAATAAGLPRAGTGGLIGVTVSPYGLVGRSVCVAGLSTKQAAGIDIASDGALPATNIGNSAGSLRGINGAANPLAPTATVPADAAYNESTITTPWTMCRTL
jgi:prepilin-type N-terminal cleavage/methylation domain-containing protein